jgi:hypothetical protein
MASQHHYNSDLEAEGWLKRERTLTDIRYTMENPKEEKSWLEISYPWGEDVHAIAWARWLQNHRNGLSYTDECRRCGMKWLLDETLVLHGSIPLGTC